MDLSLHTVCLSIRMHPFAFAGEENSRVQAHIDGDEFSAHILTDETEYNIEVTTGFRIIYYWRCQKVTILFYFPYSFKPSTQSLK